MHGGMNGQATGEKEEGKAKKNYGEKSSPNIRCSIEE